MKRKEFFVGILLGTTIFGATPAMASGIIAELSNQPIFVDGDQVEMDVYTINGNSYVELHDIGEIMGFDVSWNDTQQRVDIDCVDNLNPQAVAEMIAQTYLTHDEIKTAYRITLENETIKDKLSTGEEPTRENIKAMLDEFAVLYPDFTSWGANYNDGDIYWYNDTFGCNSYAELLRDVLYGAACAPVSTHHDVSNVREGDVVYLKNNTTGRGHWVVVSGVGESFTGAKLFYTMSGNVNHSVSIDAPYYLEATLQDYPDSTVYCYY